MNAELRQPDLADTVLLARGGDREAFRPLVERYKNAVSAVALSIVRDVAESHDIAQEAFVEAWSNLPRLREPKSFGPWILQITRRRALQSLRTDSRKRARDERWQAVAPLVSSDAEALAREQEMHQDLYTALEALPDDARELLILFYREGHSTKRVAALLELSDAAVRKRLERAREALREKAEELGAFALASAPPFAFVLQVQRRIILQAPRRPPSGRRGVYILGAAGLVVVGLIAWQHFEFEAEADAIRLHANEFVQAAAEPARADHQGREPGAPDEPQAIAPDQPDQMKSAAALPALEKSPAPRTTTTASQPLLAPALGMPGAAIGVDLERLLKSCERCRIAVAQLAEVNELEAKRARRRKAEALAPGSARTDPASSKMSPSELALLVERQAFVDRQDLAIHAVMRAHGAVLVVDSPHTFSPLLDATDEVARLLDTKADLSLPGIAQVKQPLRISGIDVHALTEWADRSLETQQAVLPQSVVARAAVVNFARAMRDNADGLGMNDALPGRARVLAVELERRLREELAKIAGRRELTVVFKREVILDNDSEVEDLTSELIRGYDETYAPSPLQLPDMSLRRAALTDISRTQLSDVLAEVSRRNVDLNRCVRLSEHIYFFAPRASVRGLFQAVADQFNLAWSDDGTFIRARCSRVRDESELALEKTKPDLASVMMFPETRGSDCSGIRLLSIPSHSPWIKRGARSNDLLIEVNGASVCKDHNWPEAFSRATPNGLVVIRHGQTLHL